MKGIKHKPPEVDFNSLFLFDADMEGASTTRLRFKDTTSSHKRKRKHSHSHSHSHSYSHSNSQSRPASGGSRPRSRSRSRSPIISSRRHHRHHSRKRSRSPPLSTGDPISKGERRPEFASVSTECFYDGQDDDSYYSREAAYLREQEQEKERAERYQQQDEDPWLSHLFDELANDDPYEFHSDRFEAQSFEHYYERDARSHINNLSDADYTYYMRRGMKRSRQSKADKEWMEWVEEQEKIRYQQAREEQKRKDERRSRKRQERKERKEHEARMRGETDSSMENSPANRLRKKALVERARQAYENGWKILLESSNDDTVRILSMDKIPWPPLNATQEESIETTTTGSTTSLSLFDFLFFGTTAEQQDIRKQLLRREQLRFHPDKFKQRFGARLPPAKVNSNDNNINSSDSNNDGSDDYTGARAGTGTRTGTGKGERERILEMVDRVARALNEMSELL